MKETNIIDIILSFEDEKTQEFYIPALKQLRKNVIELNNNYEEITNMYNEMLYKDFILTNEDIKKYSNKLKNIIVLAITGNKKISIIEYCDLIRELYSKSIEKDIKTYSIKKTAVA